MARLRPLGPGPGLVLAGLAFAALSARAATRVVPADFPTIQEAVDASADSDTVLVLPGTYVENITITQEVVVRSTGGPAVTVIDGGSPANPAFGAVVTFFGAGVLSGGAVEGFDIRHGTGWGVWNQSRMGGGILVIDTVARGPLIRDNWIHDNTLAAPRNCLGAGVGVSFYFIGHEASARIVSNRIYDNRVDGFQTQTLGDIEGVAIYGEDVLVEGNEIYANLILGSPPPPWPNQGRARFIGGVVVHGGLVRNNIIACNTGWRVSALSGSGRFEHNTIVANVSFDGTDGATVRVWGDRNYLCVFTNNIVSDNAGPGLSCYQSSIPPYTTFEIYCNDIYGSVPGDEVVGACGPVIGVNGNLSEVPQYGRVGCEPSEGNWCLGPGSPLLPENAPPGCGLIGAAGACPGIAVRDAAPGRPRTRSTRRRRARTRSPSGRRSPSTWRKAPRWRSRSTT